MKYHLQQGDKRSEYPQALRLFLKRRYFNRIPMVDFSNIIYQIFVSPSKDPNFVEFIGLMIQKDQLLIRNEYYSHINNIIILMEIQLQDNLQDNHSVLSGQQINDMIQSQQKRNSLCFQTGRRILDFYGRSKACISANRDKIYLIVTLATIVYSFYSYKYYQNQLICDLATEWDCMHYRLKAQQKNVLTYAILILTDCSILVFYIYAFIYKKTYRILIGLGVIQQIFLFYRGSSEMNFFNMMGIIIAVHRIILFVIILLTLLTASIKFCCKKSILLTVGGLLFFGIFFFLGVFYNQCDSWKVGINGEIQDIEGSCKMNVPMCSYFKGVALIDFNIFLHNCFLGEDYKKIFNDRYSYDIENGTIIGFSDLKNASEYQRSHAHFQKKVFESAKRYKTLKQAKETMNHDVIFDTDDQRYYIQVLHNQTLAKEKDELYKKYSESSSPPLVKNVLLLFIDSVSRFETHIKLPKLVRWFKKQARYRSYSKQEPTQQGVTLIKEEAFEFYKFHALGYTTEQSLYPMFYGETIFQMFAQTANSSNPRYNSLHKDFSQRGFVTSYASSLCYSYGADIFDTELQAVINPIADHQTFSFSCDPNFYTPGMQFAYSRGMDAVTDRCLYHKKLSDYAFQYTTSFFDKYKNSSKLSQINLLEGHTFYGGSVKYIDSGITQFLEQLQAKGHLKNTLVIALSDHGQHFGNTIKSISSDHFNPLLYMAVPQAMNSKYRDKIRLNQQNLITAFNIYHFLRHIAIGEQYPNKQLGLLADLSFQVNCSIAKVPFFRQQGQTCYCK